MVRKHQAVERLTLEGALARAGPVEAHVTKLLARLRRLRPIEPGAAVVDIGAAQGLFVIACAKRGFKAVGVEPWEQARALARRIAEREGVDVRILPGTAEHLPLPSGAFEIAHANSVIEHVRDAQAAFDEAARVLAPGGVFWFSAASSLCPRQREIAHLPAFGWYPDRLKRRIMEWAGRKRPHWIGHTHAPAIQWFTPPKARRMLRRAGFRQVHDRWDLRLGSEGGWLHAAALAVIRSSGLTKLLADVLVPACSFAAVK